MKKLLLITTTITLLSSCDEPKKVGSLEENSNVTMPVYVFEYDGHEYIRFSSGRDSWGGHKANCKYCINK